MAAAGIVGLAAVALVVLPARVAGAADDVVTNCNGSASVPGSLPNEVTNASAHDSVTFSLSPSCSLITLSSTIDISKDLTIIGPGAASLGVSGNNSSTVFTVASGVTATISDLTVEDGDTFVGGGIQNSGTLTLADSTVSGNTADIFGGGIDNSGTLHVSDTTVSGNTSQEYGGGIANSGTTTVVDSTVSGNIAGVPDILSGTGAGIDSSQGTLTVTNSTVSSNVAVAGNGSSGDGGGISIGDSTATVMNSTLWGNSAGGGGGGIDNSGAIALSATIVANSPSGSDCAGTHPVDSGYNLADDSSCGLSATGSLADTPAGLDPSGLYDNLGPTETIALLIGSAAIHHVSTASLCPAEDQRGLPRTVPCSIGAYESEGGIVCSRISGKITGVITIKGCSPSGGHGYRSATVGSAVLTAGGGVTWHTSGQTTTISDTSFSPSTPDTCPSHDTEYTYAGTVSAASSAGAGIPVVGDPVRASMCENTQGALKLLAGTHMDL